MTSIINSQRADVGLLGIPQGTGIHNNTSASLPPTKGSICWDSQGVAGAIYSGTGTSWIATAQGGNVVGPSVANIGDLASFSQINGLAIQDSSIPSANVVQASTTSVDSNLVAYNGTGGRSIKDIGVSYGTVILPDIELVSGAGNPSIFVKMFIQKVGKIISFQIQPLNSPDLTVATPDTWTSASAVIPTTFLGADAWATGVYTGIYSANFGSPLYGINFQQSGSVGNLAVQITDVNVISSVINIYGFNGVWVGN